MAKAASLTVEYVEFRPIPGWEAYEAGSDGGQTATLEGARKAAA